VKMAFGAFQAFDDFRMAGVRMFLHKGYLSPWRGYSNPACGWWACGKTRVRVGLQAAKLGSIDPFFDRKMRSPDEADAKATSCKE
jgi:hypothetical protein